MIENLVLYLSILLGVSGAVTSFVEGVKPMLKEISKDNESLYQVIMFVARFLVGAAGIIVLGGASLFRATLPETFNVVPDLGLIAVSSLFVAGGADLLHAIRDYIYALRDGQRAENEVTSSIVTSK